MAATLLIGGVDRESAKRRRKDAYRQDLELQIKERDAAKIRERLQDMNVNASGWLDPEKRPERLKPLGGVHWTEQKGVNDTKVKPYHTLFLYGRVPEDAERRDYVQQAPSQVADHQSSRLIDSHRVQLDTPAGLKYQPVTYAGASLGAPSNSVDQAYNFYATLNLDNAGGSRSIVQPISIPYVDNRPIIVTGQGGGGEYMGPRFNPFDHRDDGTVRELRSLLGQSQIEAERARARMERDNEDLHRRLRKELEDERRKLQDQENEAKRRVEEMRREGEERRKEAERQRLEAERLRREAETRPKTGPVKPRPESKTMLYTNMTDYRKQLEDERKKIEELLKATPAKKEKDVWDIKVLNRPRVPPTPKSADRANRENVQMFNDLKHRDFETRQHFLSIFPDIPWTNRRLELQQDALIRQQEAKLRNLVAKRPGKADLEIPPRRAVSRPDWLDRNPTPFPHVLKKRDRLYTSHSWGGDLDKIHKNNQERERIIGNLSSRNEEDVIDELRLRRHRPPSAETLTDDTWLRPSSTTDI